MTLPAPSRPVRAKRASSHGKRTLAETARVAWYTSLGRCPPRCPSCASKGWTLDMPGLRLVSEANSRDHWAARVRRKRAQHWAVFSAVRSKPGPLRPRLPCVVTITRIGPRRMDSDNLAGSAKAVRDEVARMLGCDDGDESAVTWVYAQECGRFGVRVVIRPRDGE